VAWHIISECDNVEKVNFGAHWLPLCSEHVTTGQSRKVLASPNDPGTTKHGRSRWTAYAHVKNVPLTIVVSPGLYAFIAQGCTQQDAPQLLSVGACQPESCFEDSCLVPTAEVLRAQTIIAELAQLNDRAPSVWHFHDVTFAVCEAND
jgi:hypothetical protein